MKTLGLVAILFFVSGCAPVKTMQELETEAAITGDWSAVEKRERLTARRDSGIDCPAGTMSFCQTYGGQESCGCIARHSMRDIFARR